MTTEEVGVFEGDPLDVSGKGRAELREKRTARSRKRDDRLMGIRRSHSDDERPPPSRMAILPVGAPPGP